MRLAFRWKLLASYLLVTLVLAGVLYGFLSRTLGKYMVEETTAGLMSEGRLARLAAEREMADLRRDAPAVAAAMARETRARVTIIARTGEVLGDSNVPPAELKELENHLNRPEVQQALKNGEGSFIRHSATLGMAMLYVAFPFQDRSGEKGFMRLALPLSALQQTMASLHSILLLSLAVALFVSLVLSYILSHVTTKPLRVMAEIASRIGRGEFGRRVPVTSRDEVGELAAVMNDMAVRIEGEIRSVAAEKNRLDTILRGMGEGVMVADAAGVVTLVNPAFRALFDLREEVEGRPLIDITRHPSLHEAFKKTATSREKRAEELTIPLFGGITVLTHWVPLLENDRLKGVVAVFLDISYLKRLEKVRRDFVANVSHELRTPVTVIRGYAETLASGALSAEPERARAFSEKIHRHAERLSNLIDDLLALSELESGEKPPVLAPVTVEGLLAHVCTLLEEKARQKGITMVRAGGADVPPVLADRGRLEQVLFNLLDNAIKYTPENGTITVSAAEADGMVKIAVTDTGIGIPPNEQSRIFERFYRVDAARSREQGGTGLGLAIVKHIVQQHGGEVAVESAPGRGSTFTVTLRRG